MKCYLATKREFGSSNPIVSVILQAGDYSSKIMLRGHLGKDLYKINSCPTKSHFSRFCDVGLILFPSLKMPECYG